MGPGKLLLITGLLCVLKTCGSQHCGLGFMKTRRKCVDIDECDDDVPPCSYNQECYNTVGSFNCTCKKGFTAVNPTICKDINECVEDLGICGPNAKCSNTIPGYSCTCKTGFINSNLKMKTFQWGDNVTCLDINECVEDPGICGPNAKCTNTIPDYNCTCKDGFINSNLKMKTFQRGDNVTCLELHCDQYKADRTQFSSGLSNILSLMRNSCTDLSKGKPSNSTPVLLEIFKAVEDLLESSGHLNNSDNSDSSDNSDKVTELLQVVEDAVRLIGPHLQGYYTHMETSQTEVELAVRKGKTPPTGPIHLSSHNAALDTDWETLIGNGTYPGFALAALVIYKNLEKSVNHSFQDLSGHQEDGVDPNYQVYSKVVSVVMSNLSTQLLDTPVTITMRHLQEEKNTSKVKFICAYWKSGGAWATDGVSQQSTNSTHTVCRSKHLTSFAVLMAHYDLEKLFELELLTMLGLVTSLLCLAVCIFTFKFCHSIKGTFTTIHLHLCICLFIADLIFLAGISQTQYEVGCRLVAALLHYYFLGTFCWMLLIGVQLYRMMKPIVNVNKNHPWYLYAVGYGAPLVIVVISAISRPMGYGTERHCWLSLKHGFIWSFIGPVIGIIVLNVFFFIIVVTKLIQKLTGCFGSDSLQQHRSKQDLSNLQKIKKLTGSAIALLCVLGLTWVFGAFLFADSTVAVVYIFTILNSLQGALIFVFRCLRDKKVRKWYIKKLSICRPTGQEHQASSQSQVTSPTGQERQSSSQSQGNPEGANTFSSTGTSRGTAAAGTAALTVSSTSSRAASPAIGSADATQTGS